MNIAALTGALPGVSSLSPGLGQAARAEGGTGSFARIVDQALEKVSSGQQQANAAVNDMALGKADNMHQVLLSVAKADLTFRLVMEIRNKLMDALQEIQRMQV